MITLENLGLAYRKVKVELYCVHPASHNVIACNEWFFYIGIELQRSGGTKLSAGF